MNWLWNKNAHVDIQRWLEQSRLVKNTAIKLVHGESGALDAMRNHLQHTTRYRVEVAA